MKPKYFRSPRGASPAFTLIEIMLVVGIITVLMGSAIFHAHGKPGVCQGAEGPG
jgi:prepilin-type N-terminal cleavage/methylation domain-containing protein